MHFTSSNLLHDFLNGKYMFSLFIYVLKSSEKYGLTWPNLQTHPTRNPIDLNPFLTCLKWPIYDTQPVWPNPNLTRPAHFAMSMLL